MMNKSYAKSADQRSGIPNAVSQKKSSSGQGMVDHRSEATAQAKMSEMMQQKSLETAQRAGGEEEEMMQGKFIQRAPEEEEMA